jgi:hypothetical protein
VTQVAAHEGGNHLEDPWDTRDPEAPRRMAIERLLRYPGGAQVRVELVLERSLVSRQVAGKDCVRRETSGDKRLVDAVARERVDQPGCVTDEEDAAGRDAPSRAPRGRRWP